MGIAVNMLEHGCRVLQMRVKLMITNTDACTAGLPPYIDAYSRFHQQRAQVA